MRKLLVGAVAAIASIAVAAGAIAQTPESTFTAKVSPADAGTPRAPKNTTLNFNVTLNKPNTTVEFIDLNLPSTLKLSGKGLGHCTPGGLYPEITAACKAAKAGPEGEAHAMLSPDNLPLTFTVQPYVQDKNTLLIYVAGIETLVQSPIPAAITDNGHKLRIRIPLELRQPIPGSDASLTGLDQTFSAKKGNRYLVSSVGCKNRKHKFTGKLTFTQRFDGAPVPGPVGLATSARCKK